MYFFFFFSSRRRHTRLQGDWSSDVCSSDLNFAIANAYYFLFGFALFGSTVLIPQMLQSLYGYTATDAGLVLGPGAFVIVALAPLIVRTLPKVGITPLIFTGYIIFGIAMWRYASID